MPQQRKVASNTFPLVTPEKEALFLPYCLKQYNAYKIKDGEDLLKEG
jgi:hypothetical protein